MTTIRLHIIPGKGTEPPIVLASAHNHHDTEKHPGEFITANTDAALVARTMLQAAAYLFAQGQPVRFAADIPLEVLK